MIRDEECMASHVVQETPAIHPADLARNVCLPLDGKRLSCYMLCFWAICSLQFRAGLKGGLALQNPPRGCSVQARFGSPRLIWGVLWLG
jgi:hypothetical protein